MKKLLLAAAISAAAAIAPAHADYYVKDGNGALKLFKAGTLAGSVVLPYNSLTDSNGLPFGTTSNPVAMRFGTGVFLPDFSNPQHVICDSGCSGGGGGGGLSVPFAGPIGANGTPIGFKDASGNLQPMLGDVTDGQWVSIKASVPISLTGTLPAFASTPTVNIGTAPTITVNGSVSLTGTLPAFAATPTFNLGTLNGAATAANQTAVQGTVGGGAAATASQLAGAIYNSSPLTLTNGQGAALQADANGYLRVNVMTGGGGSSPFGAAFPASGVALGMSQGGNLVGVTGTSGNLNVQCANCSGSGVSTADQASFTAGASLFAGSGGVFNDGLAALSSGQQAMERLTSARGVHMNLRNATGTELGVAAAPLQVSLANTGANGTALLVTGTGGTFPVSQASAASLNATVVGTGIFAVQAAQSGTWNINAITTLPALPTGSNIIGRVGIDQTTPGTTNLVSIGTNGTVNPTTAANWGINTLGSTTSGQSGQLALGAVTTSAPTYTTAQSNALSLTTAGALRVDGSGVTQPVSLASTTITGTVAVTQSGSWSLVANQSVNVAQINGVTPLMGNGVTGTGSPRVTIASDNTPFSVNAVQSGTWNISTLSTLTSLSQFAGNAINLGAGTVGTGTLRVTQASDSPVATALGQPGATACVSDTASCNTNQQLQRIAQNITTQTAAINGPIPTQASTISIGAVGLFAGGAAISNTNGIFSNLLQGNSVLSSTNGLYSNVLQGNAALSATNGIYANQLQGNAVLSQTNPSWSRSTDGTNAQIIDPCQTQTVQSTPINISTATTTRIATESASVRIYICHLSIVTNAANNVALIEGTGSSCAGGTPAGMAGGTTASSGWNFSANGGISLGMGGYSINQTANLAYSVCLVTSAATQLSGVMKWVQR